jgi:hypothetical protein
MPANVRSRLPAIPSPIEGRTIKALINHTAAAKRTPRKSVEESHRKPDHEVEAGLEYRAGRKAPPVSITRKRSKPPPVSSGTSQAASRASMFDTIAIVPATRAATTLETKSVHQTDRTSRRAPARRSGVPLLKIGFTGLLDFISAKVARPFPPHLSGFQSISSKQCGTPILRPATCVP